MQVLHCNLSRFRKLLIINVIRPQSVNVKAKNLLEGPCKLAVQVNGSRQLT